MKRVAGVVLMSAMTCACVRGQVDRAENAPPGAKARNVILFIGDGMGPGYVEAAAYAKHGQQLNDGKPPKLFFETFPVYGVATTFSHNSFVTDSAAAATSLASGIKTINGALGVDADGNAVETIAEFAHKQGMATALVTSVSVNHATPAAFYAHQSLRGSYRNVLDDYFSGSVPDVLFGGGVHDKPMVLEYAISQAEEHEVLYYDADTRGEIDAKAALGRKVLGYFGRNSDHHLDYMNQDDRFGEPELSDITLDAMKIIAEKDKPFFMMVEGGAIDWAGHANNGPAAISEVLEFDDTIQKTVEFLKEKNLLEQTLIIVTADHETGGLALNGPYLAKLEGDAIQMGWTSTNHTAISVPVYAMGPGAEMLAGKVDQTYIHTVMKQVLED